MRKKINYFIVTVVLVNSFSVKAQRSVPTAYDPGVVKVNFIRTWDAAAPEQNAATLMTRPVSDARMATQFFDGLGRPLQTVMKKSSLETNPSNPVSAANAVDMVSPVEYDEYGREQYKYLSFAANNSGGNTSVSDGFFKMNPFQQQAAFMSSQYGSQGESFFYGQTSFEISPLNRIDKTMPAGNSWTGSSRGNEVKYWLNTPTDDVKIWTVANSGTNGVFGTYTLLTSVNSGVYQAGQLQKNVMVDEHGKQVIEFKDKLGKVILKKVQLTATADDGTGSNHTGWICTYYIYDDFGSLRCVIQPEGVKALPGLSWSLSSGILAEQCFRYEYDARDRMIMKKIPGAGEVYMVYDARDRIVMTQDAKMRSSGQWMVNKYDDFNRPVESGTWTNSSTSFDQHLQNAYTNSTGYPTTSSGYELLTKVHYDDYTSLPSGLSDYLTSWSGNFAATDNSHWPYPVMPQKTTAVKGMVTWTQTKVLGSSSDFINSATYYDNRGRVIQVQSTNITGGTDVSGSQYSWAGQALVTVYKQQKGQSNPQEHVVITKNEYDELGRLITVKKSVNSTINGSAVNKTEQVIVKNEYDKLGQLKIKKLGANTLETMNYEYNIRGWLLGANRDYAKDLNSSNYFGFDLGYDKVSNGLINNQSYAAAQYNGNICGMVWKSKGDGEKRKYDFSYDAANRIMKADFKQYSSGVFADNASFNFDVLMGSNGSNVNDAYDYNGNIIRMQQWGMKITGGLQIDDLNYSYEIGSNKLKQVIDLSNDNGSVLGDFKYDASTKTSSDYSYDVNGNLSLDNNKKISSITYNFLNLPSLITVTGKGTIAYTYDAAGNKLSKTVTETGQPVKSTLYAAGAVYENDVLQFIGHEEGRIRFKPGNGQVEPAFHFDYMLKDHLGNVRMVLTEEQQFDKYPLASLETSKLSIESNYYNIDASKIVDASTVSGLPAYTNDMGIGNNPLDPTFSAAYSDKVYKLNSSTNKTGLGMALKVMAGDKVDVLGRSYYNQYNSGGSGANAAVPILEILNALIGSSTGATVGGHTTATELNTLSSVTGPINGFTGDPGRDNSSYPTRPKAFINYIFLDEQFHFVSGGFSPVNNTAGLKNHYSDLQNLTATKNGYIYIYASNESPVDVYFDNLQVVHTRGPILEETHYYPFGLTMAGISSKALNGIAENKKKYQGYEFNADLDLNVYESFFRTHDPQLGRFWQIDPKPYYQESLYAAMGNNPVKNFDILGDELGGADKESAKRQEEIIKSTAKGKDGSAFNNLVKLKKDGMTFMKINQKKLDKALSQIQDVDQRSLARGYAKAINSKDQMFVRIVNKNENPDIENKKMDKRWGTTEGSAAIPIGRTFENNGGGVTQFMFGQSLSVIVMNSTFETTYENKFTGEVVKGVSSAGEIAAHEILGHGLGKFSESSTYQNQDAIRMSNLYRRASGDNTLYRTGEVHPPGNIRMTSEEANQIPNFL